MSDILHYSPSVCVTHRCNLNCVYCYQKHENVSISFDTAKNVIENMMRSYNVCNEGQIARRASSVQGWLKWIFNLIKL